MADTRAWWATLAGVATLLAAGLSGCPSQTSGDDDDTAISDDDTSGGDDDAGGDWEVIHSDDFERPDGPLGDAYEVLVWGGNEFAEIQDGAVVVDADYFAVRFDQALDDVTIRISADLSYGLVGNGVEDALCGVVARYQVDPQGDYPSYAAFLDAGLDEIALQRTLVSGVDGHLEVVAGQTQPWPVQPDAVYRTVLTVGAGDFSADFDDATGGAGETISLQDPSPLSGGEFGVHGQLPGDVVVTIDDLLIERHL